MGQSALASLIEGVINEAVSFMTSVLIQLFALPLLGLEVQLGQSLQIAAIFTSVGIVRMFTIRRIFNFITRLRSSAG